MTENEGKERQAIWGVRKKHEFLFYTALLICGVAVAGFTLWKERYDETWLEIFDILWSRIFGSVVVVWFAYQAFDWSALGIRLGLMSAGDFFRRQIRRRKEEEFKRVQKWLENGCRKREFSKEQIQQLQKLTEGLENLEKKRED